MVYRAERADLKKVTIRLGQDQIDQLKLYYPKVGYNMILRSLAARHLRKLNEKEQEALSLTSADERMEAVKQELLSQEEIE